jgi:hypothetical protein
MASILKVDEMQGVTSAGDITITSEGGAATQSLQQGLAKAWINMFGDDASTRDTLNVASTSDDAVGQKTVNLTSSFSSADFATTTSVGENISSAGNRASTSSPTDSNTYLFYTTSSNTGSYNDNDYMTASSFGDLA